MGSTSQSNPSSSGAIEAGPASSLSVHAEDVAGMTPEKHTASESTDTVQPLSPSVAEKEEHVAAPPRTATLHDIDLSYRAPPAIAWRSHPLRDEVPESWLVLMFTFAMGWLTFLATTSLVTTLFVAALFLATCSRAWLPVAWEVSREGVMRRRFGVATKWPWRRFATYQVDRRGILFTACREPQPWHFLRSVHVPWSPHQDQLLALVAHYMGPPPNQNDDC